MRTKPFILSFAVLACTLSACNYQNSKEPPKNAQQQKQQQKQQNKDMNKKS